MSRQGKPRVKILVSAGGVVYRQQDGVVETVLCGLCLRPGARSIDQGEHVRSETGETRVEQFRWSLAKGTPDEGETIEETAIREVQEETGLDVKLESPIGSINYWFTDRDGSMRYHKTVHFYLMVSVGGDTARHDPEFDVVQWFPFDEALKTVAYPNEAGVLRQARELIAKHGGST